MLLVYIFDLLRMISVTSRGKLIRSSLFTGDTMEDSLDESDSKRTSDESAAVSTDSAFQRNVLRDEFLINMQKFASSISRTIQQIEGEVKLECPDIPEMTHDPDENVRNEAVREQVRLKHGKIQQLGKAEVFKISLRFADRGSVSRLVHADLDRHRSAAAPQAHWQRTAR